MAPNAKLNLGTIKELEALQFDHKRSKNKELQELCLELINQKACTLRPQHVKGKCYLVGLCNLMSLETVQDRIDLSACVE